MDPDKEKAISDLAAEVRDDPALATDDTGEQSTRADSDDQQVEPATTGEADEESTTAQTDRHQTKAVTGAAPRGGQTLAAIALLLAIAAFVGSGYLWYQLEVQQRHEQEVAEVGFLGELKTVGESTRALEKAQDKLSAEQDQLSAEQKQLSAEQDQLGTQIQEKLEGSVAALKQEQQDLTNSVSKIYESLGRNIDSWALEEVEQLLRMANHSVSLAGDFSTAIAGLELADKRLSELGNPQYIPIRELITDEITQLKSIEQADIPGLALNLSSLTSAARELPLASQPDRAIGGDASASSPDAAEGNNMWVEAGQALLSDLKGLVSIQNVSEAAKPLLAPEQRYFLIANLRLMLSGAQIAALRTDTKTYQSNLDQAVQWLEEYFDTESKNVQTMIAELKSIAGQDLRPARPDISRSLAELKTVKSRMQAE